MQGNLDLLFSKPVMTFDNIISDNELQFVNMWLKEHFRKNNSTRADTFSPLFTVNSSHKWDPRLQDNVELNELCNKFVEASKIMANKLGYIETAERLFIKDMWAYIGSPGDFVQTHLHQNSFISGAFYLQVPDNCKLIFKDYNNMFKMPDRWNDINKIQNFYDLIPNRLLLFRSDLPHGTPVIPAGVDKVTISFNIQFHPDDLYEGGPTQNLRSVK
tara:strand:+ start:429 stop:1076 length:648 start_codon:yes stop_codon:yes gene_type:complete